jgi:predicted dehydrogenase
MHDEPLGRVRVGVAGGGFVAQAVHLPLLRERRDRFALVALADPSPRVREGLAARYGIPRTHRDAEAMLAAGGLDAVLVCSPNGAHAATVLAALDAGVHVLVEKPLCIVPADAERIVAAAAGSGCVVQVGYMKRFDRAYERLLAELPAGEPPCHVATATYDPWLPRWFAPADLLAGDDVPRAEAARLAALTAGQVRAAAGSDDPADVRSLSEVFLGALVHDVNLVHGILERLGAGPGVPVDAAVAAGGEAASALVALPGGARWTLAFMLLRGLGDFRERVEVYGAGGVHSLEFPAPYLRGSPTRYRRLSGGEHGWASAGAGSWEEPYARQLDAFHASVTAGAPCRTPPAQARDDVALLVSLFRLALGSRS